MDRTENLRHIAEELAYLGATGFPEKTVGDLVKSNADKIQVSGKMEFMEFGEPKKMDYTVFFKKYQEPNLYHPYGYQATLPEQPEKTRAFQVRMDAYFEMQDAFNLLNGRAVQKLTLNWNTRKVENAWYQLDFAKKDQNGNAALEKLSVRDQDFKLVDSLKRYPIKEMMNQDQRVDMFLSLFRGNAVPVTILNEGKEHKAFALASPKLRTVDIFSKVNGQLVKLPVKTELKRTTGLSESDASKETERLSRRIGR